MTDAEAYRRAKCVEIVFAEPPEVKTIEGTEASDGQETREPFDAAAAVQVRFVEAKEPSATEADDDERDDEAEAHDADEPADTDDGPTILAMEKA